MENNSEQTNLHQFYNTSQPKKILDIHLGNVISMNALQFVPSGDVAVSMTNGYKRGRVISFNMMGQHVPLGEEVSSIKNPHGIAVDQESSLLVITDIQGWGENSFCVMSPYTKHQDVHKVFFPPYSAAFSLDGDLILGGGYTGAVARYRTNGQQLWEKRTRYYCYDLTVDKDNRIIATHLYGNRVHVYDASMAHKFSFPDESQRDLLTSTSGVCTDSQANILLCDGKARKVSVWDSEGHHLRDLVTRMDVIPGKVALHDDRWLAVGGHIGRYPNKIASVAVYDLAADQ